MPHAGKVKFEHEGCSDLTVLTWANKKLVFYYLTLYRANKNLVYFSTLCYILMSTRWFVNLKQFLFIFTKKKKFPVSFNYSYYSLNSERDSYHSILPKCFVENKLMLWIFGKNWCSILAKIYFLVVWRKLSNVDKNMEGWQDNMAPIKKLKINSPSHQITVHLN